MKKNNYLPSTALLISLVSIATFTEVILMLLLKSSLLNFIVIFLINIGILSLVFYARSKFQIDRLELINFSNENAEESLQHTLEVLPIGIIKYNPTSYQAEWF
ncbi:MAG: hypothetical protein LBI13_00245, partial [Streptococcaceae bacterium]|nr:hypothetical protein [Streptococcaceae bacterium]